MVVTDSPYLEYHCGETLSDKPKEQGRRSKVHHALEWLHCLTVNRLAIVDCWDRVGRRLVSPRHRACSGSTAINQRGLTRSLVNLETHLDASIWPRVSAAHTAMRVHANASITQTA